MAKHNVQFSIHTPCGWLITRALPLSIHVESVCVLALRDVGNVRKVIAASVHPDFLPIYGTTHAERTNQTGSICEHVGLRV